MERLAETIPDKPDCTDYGVLLSIAWPSQPSRTVWLAEVLRAEPEFRSWLAPGGGVALSQTLYGPRNYGRGQADVSDISRQAFAIHCADPLRCRAFAGFYAQVHREAKPQPFCGAIPGNTGGPAPVDVEKLMARPRPFPHGACARWRACQAAADQPVTSCDGLDLPARTCAELPTCAAALDCFARSPKNPKRRLWSDEPPASPGF